MPKSPGYGAGKTNFGICSSLRRITVYMWLCAPLFVFSFPYSPITPLFFFFFGKTCTSLWFLYLVKSTCPGIAVFCAREGETTLCCARKGPVPFPCLWSLVFEREVGCPERGTHRCLITCSVCDLCVFKVPGVAL